MTSLQSPVAVVPSGEGLPTATGPSWTLRLPFVEAKHVPTLNHGGNWRVHAHARAAWRKAAAQLAREARIPACDRVRVELVYTPATRRRRDPDNLVAALKPCCDALVDAKVVPDDTAEFVTRLWPRIAEPVKTLPDGESRFVLIVTAQPAFKDGAA